MNIATPPSRGVLGIVPFMVQDALPLLVFREMIDRGFDLTVAFYFADGGGYLEDAAEDLRAADRLIDLSGYSGDGIAELEAIVRSRRVGLIVQTGAPQAYAQLPYVKQAHPSIRIIDILFNEIGHTLSHFLYEACFDGVIVESEAMMRYIQESSAKADPGARLVLSGVDLDKFAFLPTPIRSTGGGLVVGYLGRMSPEKNPLGFVDLAERLHARLPSLTFRMYGSGPMKDEVASRVATSHIGHALSFDGFAPTSMEALHEIDVLIVPSILDGRPVTIMEASSCGVPVIGAPVGGIPELIRPGRNGYLLPPGDIHGIAGVLATWIDDRSSLESLRRSSRAVAEERFDRRVMLDRYEAVFREFLVGDGRW